MPPGNRVYIMRKCLILLGCICATTLVIGWGLYPVLDAWDRVDRTQLEMLCFRAYVTPYCNGRGRIPRGPLVLIVHELLVDPVRGDAIREKCPMIIRNKDAWGRAFIFEVDANGRKAVIRSRGPNGQDDMGGSDDIQFSVVVPP
jgi:hypothetical protein